MIEIGSFMLYGAGLLIFSALAVCVFTCLAILVVDVIDMIKERNIK